MLPASGGLSLLRARIGSATVQPWCSAAGLSALSSRLLPGDHCPGSAAVSGTAPGDQPSSGSPAVAGCWLNFVGHQFSCSYSTSASVCSNSSTDEVLSTPPLGASASVDASLPDLGLCNPGGHLLDLLHASLGLPWWAVIPLTTFSLKTLLVPLSLRQAAVVRSHVTLWGEAHSLLQQQDAKKAAAAVAAAPGSRPGPYITMPGTDTNSSSSAEYLSTAIQAAATVQPPPHTPLQPPAAALAAAAPDGVPGASDTPPLPAGNLLATTATQSAPPAAPAFVGQVPPAVASQLQQLSLLQARVRLYHQLRLQCGVPHPAWLLANNLIQWPVFVYMAASVRRMALAGWPGLSTEGALWFPDLTMAAVVLQPNGSLLLPMGWLGLVLPLSITALMLTSIRIGFRAAGAASKHPSLQGTWMASALQYMQPLLYTLTVVNTVVKLQLPYATLLHWGTSSSYTLGLQTALRHPKLRAWLGQAASSQGATGTAAAVDPGLVARVAANPNANVLVVIAAQQAAAQRYNNALYCLSKALEMDPHNIRAHYSSGQVHALCNNWQAAATSYAAAAEAALPEHSNPSAYGQAMYCLAIAQQRLQRYESALASLSEADHSWPQPYTVALCRVHCLDALGRQADAVAVIDAALQNEVGNLESQAVRHALESMRAKLQLQRQETDAASRVHQATV